MLQPIIDFGKRREEPCFDCDERGHCTMNCSPPPGTRRDAGTGRVKPLSDEDWPVS